GRGRETARRAAGWANRGPTRRARPVASPARTRAADRGQVKSPVVSIANPCLGHLSASTSKESYPAEPHRASGVDFPLTRLLVMALGGAASRLRLEANSRGPLAFPPQRNAQWITCQASPPPSSFFGLFLGICGRLWRTIKWRRAFFKACTANECSLEGVAREPPTTDDRRRRVAARLPKRRRLHGRGG